MVIKLFVLAALLMGDKGVAPRKDKPDKPDKPDEKDAKAEKEKTTPLGDGAWRMVEDDEPPWMRTAAPEADT